MDNLSVNIQYIKGVGPKRASRLKKLNINSVSDLLYHVPRDYEDRTKFISLKEAPLGEKASLEIEIIGPGQIIRPRRNMSILKVPFQDSSGMGYLVWFNQEYLKDKFRVGEKFRVNGKINKMGMETQVMNPVYEKADRKNQVGQIIPIYDLTYGLSNNELRKILNNALKDYLYSINDILPLQIRKRHQLIGIQEALKNVHIPNNSLMLKEARRRLIFEELFLLQLGLLIIKNKSLTEEKGVSFPEAEEVNTFIQGLPFKLTNAQERVFQEIQQDMSGEKQMSRLVQGDVGSGKTIVAALAMFRAVKGGYQAAMMAPTEILAVQHYDSLMNLFKEYGIKCELLVGSLTNKRKMKVLEELKSGNIHILVGTHALIQDNVEFDRLGLVITDEQHRFGVKQRAVLNQKGINPDILVMTATPIPRTLALILYGDLDISIIDELPPGRKEVETYAVGEEMIDRVNKFIEKQLIEGRQAYVVCPLIEESDDSNLNSAEELYENFKNTIFKDYKVGLLHGKMKAQEKDEIMGEFKDGKMDILISTTVIEVGVNVPNSNIMVIYNAERFGLAQLHQLRGRVGRGEYQSYCILINSSKTQIARERMRILQGSSDGFVISEKDLELRGPGEFFGTKQHGLPELKIANLFKDMDILKIAQSEALNLIKNDPGLKNKEHEILKKRIQNMFKDAGEDLILN